MTDNMRVPGYCPMGCGQTLERRGTDGVIQCQATRCPRVYAVQDLLTDRETEHIVQFDTTGFTVRHPLRERIGDALMQCTLHRHCASLSGPPADPGRYRAVRVDGEWRFQRLDAQEAADA
ncbi:DUF6085 family protein [Streptomyces sp. NPDC005648]|uniref:DUF6085 family protein n=1 Tax=Streptomyces sp. NPDC005648 TaxID=3157044 RepID=UPI0033AFDD83